MTRTRVTAAAFVLFLAVRLVACGGSSLLEDHDSVSYLIAAETIADLDLQGFAALSPDTTPFYPLLVALCSVPGWSTELAARVASLLMACVMFWSLVGVARWLDLDERVTLGAALALVAVNPTLIGLGYAVLSEPTYLGLVYLGFWLFTRTDGPARPRDGLLLGLTLGAAFLTRIEGLLFVAVYPALLLLDAVWRRRARIEARRVVGWSVALAIGFGVLAVPQMLWVSERLGRPAINGRQVWMKIMSVPGEMSYEQRIYGLDHDAGQVNLEYLQEHPEALHGGSSSLDVGNLIRIVARNTDELLRDKTGQLLGPLILALIGLGVIGLIRRGEGRRLALLAAWAASTAVGPLLYNVADRHIAVLLPVALLLAGAGVAELGQALERRLGRRAVPAALGVAVLAASTLAVPLYRATLGLPERGDYDPRAIEAIAELLRGDARSAGLATPVVCARTAYLPYAAGATRVPLPFTDGAGLAGYLAASGADYLFLEHPLIGSFPLAREYADPDAPRPPGRGALVLLDRRESHLGGSLELYRVIR